MKVHDFMATAINEVLDKDLDWQYGEGFAELPHHRGDESLLKDARFAVQFASLYESCFDWTGERKERLNDAQCLMLEFWCDDGFNDQKRQALISGLRSLPQLAMFV